MTITFDKDADALHIRLVDGEHNCRSVHISDDIAVDFEGDRAVGIEVHGASRLLGNAVTPTLALEHIEPIVATDTISP